MATILATTPEYVEGTSGSTASDQCDQPRWQESLKNAVRTAGELAEILNLPPNTAQHESNFPIVVPREFIARMKHGDPADPLLRQVLPAGAESDAAQQVSGALDPVGDLNATRQDGLIQKYRGRLLVIASGICAVNCRYCFRRHFPYEKSPKGHAALDQALKMLRKDSTLDEVILSGGDPLMLADKTIAAFTEQLETLDHIKRLRVHTRLPVVIPSRICDSLTDWVRNCGKSVYFVLHFNHANEIDQSTISAITQLRASGATVLNQAVLLKGVNDSFAVQRDLCEKLVNNNVLPYYLHQLDAVRGAMHFETDEQLGREIVAQLREHLPGFAVPRFVREIPGQPSKTPL